MAFQVDSFQTDAFQQAAVVVVPISEGLGDLTGRDAAGGVTGRDAAGGVTGVEGS